MPAPPPDEVGWVRVDDPDHPEAIARSARGAILPRPPATGSWAWEAVPTLDEIVVDGLMSEETGVSRWQEAGFTGAGVRVAVFDLQWSGVGERIPDERRHDCWVHRSCTTPIDDVRPRFDFEQGAHGTACAEVLESVAPDAEIHVVRVNSRTMFESAVDWAIQERIDVVSMSMSFFNTSFYDGTGPFAQEVRRLREAGVLLVASAGNYARGHRAGPWRDADGDRRFDGDGDNAVEVYLRPGAGRVYVTWNQFDSCGSTDLDLRLLGPDGTIVGRSRRDQSVPSGPEGPACTPLETVADVPTEGWHRVEIELRRGTTTDLRVDVLAPGGRVTNPDGGSVVDPGVQPGVLTVGAVDVNQYGTAEAAVYSGRGPSVGGWNKPDLAGPDGLSTYTFGVRGFFGTSASTPVVAGMVALVMSRRQDLTSYEAAEHLRAWADPAGPLGVPDPNVGAGTARLPDLVAQAGCAPQGSALAVPVLGVGAGLLGRRRSRGRDNGRRPSRTET